MSTIILFRFFYMLFSSVFLFRLLYCTGSDLPLALSIRQFATSSVGGCGAGNSSTDELHTLFSRERLALFLQHAKEISISARSAMDENAAAAAAAAAVQHLLPQQQSPSSMSSSSSVGGGGGGGGGAATARSPAGFRAFAFSCPLCSLVYRTQAFLNEHMRKEHSILI